MKTLSGISKSTMTKFLEFSFGDDFHMCNLNKAKGEFQILISDDVTKEEEERWKEYWKGKSIKLQFLRFAPPE